MCTSQGPRTAYALCLLRAAHHWQRSIVATTGNLSWVSQCGQASAASGIFRELTQGASSTSVFVALLQRVRVATLRFLGQLLVLKWTLRRNLSFLYYCARNWKKKWSTNSSQIARWNIGRNVAYFTLYLVTLSLQPYKTMMQTLWPTKLEGLQRR